MRIGDDLRHRGAGHQYTSARYRQHHAADFMRQGGRRAHARPPFEVDAAGSLVLAADFPPAGTCIQRSMGSACTFSGTIVSMGTSSRPARSSETSGSARLFCPALATCIAGASGSTSCQSSSAGNPFITSASSTGAADGRAGSGGLAASTAAPETAAAPPSTTRQTSGESDEAGPPDSASRASIIADNASVSTSSAPASSRSTPDRRGDADVEPDEAAPESAATATRPDSALCVVAGSSPSPDPATPDDGDRAPPETSSRFIAAMDGSWTVTKSAVMDSISAADKGRSATSGALTVGWPKGSAFGPASAAAVCTDVASTLGRGGS